MLYAENVTKSFGAVDVLDGLSFIVGDGEKVGLVGPNGGGKSTILRLLAGEETPDRGAAGHRGGALGYLRQEAGLNEDNTLVEELWLAFPEAHAVERRLADVAHRIEAGEGDLDALVHEQARLFDEFEHLDGYRIDARIGRVLDGLGFEPGDGARKCGAFSGGWQMRIALAKVLVRRPENMLLDEPTNHLDAKTRLWLAEELGEYPGTLLMVTHDGVFLDKVVTRIFDLREKAAEPYAGNYSEYQKQKAARLQEQDRTAARQEREFEKQERFIERFRAKATKTAAVQSREKQLAKVERIERTKKEAEVHFQLNAHGRTERDVLMMKHVGHTYGDYPVLIDVSLHVERGQKVAFIGPNGSGKSTLLKIAARQVHQTEGTVEWAERARPGGPDRARRGAVSRRRRARCEAADRPRAVPLQGRRCLQAGARAFRWRTQPGGAGEVPHPADERAPPGRADEPPGPDDAAQADRGAAGLRGHHPLRQPRPGHRRRRGHPRLRSRRRRLPGTAGAAPGVGAVGSWWRHSSTPGCRSRGKSEPRPPGSVRRPGNSPKSVSATSPGQ